MCSFFYMFFTMSPYACRTQQFEVLPIYHEKTMGVVSISVDLGEGQW